MSCSQYTDGRSHTSCGQIQINSRHSAIAGALLLLTPIVSDAQFTDVTSAFGLDLTHATTQTIIRVEDEAMNSVDHIPGLALISHLFSTWLTGGVAVGDYDQDGWPDIFAVGGDAGQSKLFRNINGTSFVDVTADIGLQHLSGRIAGAVFADYDGDGDVDLFIGGALGEAPRLMRNDVNLQAGFVDVFASALPDFQPEYSPNAWGGAFGDFNGDDCLDLLIPRSLLPNGPSPTFKTPEGSTQHLWQNQCDGSFTDASLSAQISQIFTPGIHPNAGRDQTFSGNFSDINNDGLSDILFTGDTSTDLILLNQGDNTFINVVDYNVITDKTAMGAVVADLNNDGHMDWFTSNIGMPRSGNRLYFGNGDGSFINATAGSGTLEGHWGWGACQLDVNLDRQPDIFHVNGFYFPDNTNPDAPGGRYDNAPAVLYVADGNGSFIESAAAFGVDDFGEGRGVSCFDFDRDGDPDIAISNHRGPFKLYRNDLPEAQRNFLTINLSGMGANTQGIGRKVYLRSQNPMENGRLMHEIRAGGNFLSDNLAEANFGLGDWQGPFIIEVDWGAGIFSQVRDLSGNQFISVPESEANVWREGFEG